MRQRVVLQGRQNHSLARFDVALSSLSRWEGQ